MCPAHEKYTCSLCGEQVPRKFCHRNRFGAYICHSCQAAHRKAGVVARTQARLRVTLHKIGGPALYAVAAFLAAIAIAVVIVELAA
jgi:hypothetical protein